ncbi:hypothetical protein GF366_00785 [Candidatus Peregrinibacteria bacterium]|nr:hypothetical protein [Candidatus Peregrinibacteria bacterium]
MAELSEIKNEKLRKLIKASKKFKSLSEKEQKKYIGKIKTLPKEKQETLIDFFTDENAKEKKAEQKQIELLQKLYDRVVQMKKDFEKLLKKDTEKKERQKEKGKMNNLLNKLENH